MHVLCPEDALVSEEMAVAFRSTQQLGLEVDLDEPDYAKRIRRAARLPWPMSLRRLMRQRDFKVLKRFFRQRMQQSLWAFASIQPVLIESFVATSVLPCKPVSYEEKLVDLAKVQQKEILGLEVIEEQLPVLQQAAYKQQIKSLMETVRAYDSIPLIMKRMVDIYRHQNVEELYRFAADPRYSSGQDALTELETRNKNWIPKMKAWMENRPTFFAVGAAHLGSYTGILQLLRLQGYTVEPVVMKALIPK
jgi:uncharacterized protein YbaP (TraB family)